MKDIKGYEGLYAVTSCGKVWSYRSKKFIKSRLRGNYFIVDLHKDNKRETCSLHRLVAETYVENPNNYPQVLHIDENASHNWINNLKWGIQKENNNAILHKERMALSKGKRVRCIETNIIYIGISEAARQTGISRSGISNCCNGKQKTSGNFHWEFVKEVMTNE